MATHASAEKASRQSIRKNIENTRTRSAYKTAVRSLKTALETKSENKEEAKKTAFVLLSDAQRLLMKAASKNVIKKKTASRHVARLSAALHRTLGA